MGDQKKWFMRCDKMFSSYAALISTGRRQSFLALITIAAVFFLMMSAVVLPGWVEAAWRPFHCPLDDAERRLMERTLQVLTSSLDAANITYFMIGGTLLGSYRYHDRVPWDDDLDLIVPLSAQSRLRSAVVSSEPNFRLFADVAAGYQWKFSASAAQPGSHTSWFSRSSARWPYVDIFFYDQNATHLWNTCPWFAEETWPLRSLFPLRRRPFGDLSLPAPCDTTTMLAVNFNLSRCRSRGFDHVRDRHLWLSLRSPAEVDCSSLEMMWPFVRRRRWVDNSGTRQVTETLWSAGGQRALREITLVDQCH